MKQIQLAMSPVNGRWYRVERTQMRYFPINRLDAIEMLRAGKAREVPYLPFSRPDLYDAYRVAQSAIQRATEAQP
jgi:hypothetical protein